MKSLSVFFTTTLIAACFVHAAPVSATDTEQATLGKILRDCAVTTRAPLPPGESAMMPEAPYIGNGEVGAVVTGDAVNGLSLFISHCAFRNHALGGVDILPEGNSDGAKYDAELTQDIARSEVGGKMTLGGVPFEVTTYAAESQPLIFCEVRNPGDTTIRIRVRTWARPSYGKGQPPTGMSHPFRIMGKYPKALSETREGIVYSDTAGPGENLWSWVATDGGGRLRNLATGHFLALTQDGKIEARKEADADTVFEARRMGSPYYTQFRRGEREIGYGLDRPDAPIAKKPAAWAGRPVEGASHAFIEGCSGRTGDIDWAGRDEAASDPVQRALLATRWIGGALVTDRPATPGESVVVIPPKSAVTAAVAVTGVCDWARNAPPDLKELSTRAQASLAALTSAKVAKLSRERVAAWDAFWNKSWLDAGDPLMNRAWFGGLHLLRCSSRVGHTSPGLYGLWHTADHTVCGNGEFNNYNYPSQIYGACSANRPELATAQLDDILREIPNAQTRAAAAGYRGAVWLRVGCFHPASDKVLDAYPQPPVAPTKDRKKLRNDQLDAGAFLAQNFIDRYEKTLDPVFQKKAYPMLRVCADFYEDYLLLNPEKNRYEFHESGAREGKGDDLNPCFSLALVKRVLASCAEWSESLGVDADRRAKWRDMTARMSGYPTAEVNGKTVYKEAENDTRISLDGPGGNVALLQMVFPADGISLDSDPKLLDTARNTLAWFNSNPNKTSWMQGGNNPAYIHAQAASLGWDGSEIHSWLRRYLEKNQRPNLVHNLWGVESCAITEGIHRMMVQGHTGILRLFPAWPKDKDSRFVRLRVKNAFLVSAELKGGQVGGVRIKSEKGVPLTAQNPWPGKSVRVTRNGKPAETVEGERFTLKTAAGEVLTLAP